MSVLDEHLKKHRARIIAREEAAFREILAAYEDVRRELRRQALILQEKIKKAQAAGEIISPSWFARERRLEMVWANPLGFSVQSYRVDAEVVEDAKK